MDYLSEPLKERTLGDGIDSSILKVTEAALSQKIPKMINHPITFKPIEPKHQIHNLKPVYVSKERKQPKWLIRKPKEPKFVPYEPYKGAVEPIIAHKSEIKAKPSKNNVEIQDLVKQMTDLRCAELSKASKEAAQNEEELIPRKKWEEERSAYETDIKNLRETNSLLENQIKFQTQVNSELKTLLVAAVGEDLESRVQHLTEDKLQLARALLNSANHLTSHQEQTEWLSGQCEVWRSKFLASSLMVEELARWKSALSNRINELQEVAKKLLDERYRVQKKLMKSCVILHGVEARLCESPKARDSAKSSNVVDLSQVICDLSQEISDLVVIDKGKSDDLYAIYSSLGQYTPAERSAMKLLQNPVTISNKQDAICNALMGTAMSLSGEQVYLKHPSSQASCCPHCTGEVKNI
ncbi:golgin-45 [Tribolium castaneum]|uniref:Golgin-45-like Protein n=1 Tax=Tribolium castaneum TaxID=7070 RepID=D7EJ20_TRICA|nr:PREDICTED: golgin-45 [Tribolium castaneum]EFA12552.1 Golgin-45-like Protein [Tribolium castaneum]|eukprot:XP_970414.1 PREDICTED: golgin-45 [Tribolium castaneum]